MKILTVIGQATADYYAIITSADFSKWRRAVFVKLTDEKMRNFKKNTVPGSTKGKKIGLKLFRGKNYVVERCLTLFC